MRIIVFILLSFILIPAVQAADNKPLIQIKTTPSFAWPLDCTYGEDCWVMNYVDMKADNGEDTDPACLSRTYDGHKGTDIAILDEKTMREGVDVLVPLNGKISKTRDEDPDQWSTPEQFERIKQARKECGNVVLIDHGDNLQTIYCHMKKRSIAVKPGQEVKQGDVIGQVGLSGFTEFPHLHFGIIQNDKIIDPFTGTDNQSECGHKKQSLWNKDLDVKYQPFVIHDLGFKNDIPELEKIEKNAENAVNLPQNSELLAFWTTFLGVREGDNITLEIKDPNGKIFAQREIVQDKTRAQQFYYVGRKTVNTPLIEGAYTASAKIQREYKGQSIEDESFSAVLIIQE